MLFQWHNSHVLNIDWIHQPLLVFCINFVQICCSTTSIFIRHGPILEFITLCDWLIVICSFFRSNLGGVYVTLGWLLPRSEFTPVPSWLYILFCLHDTTTKCLAGASRPSVSSPWFLYWGENFTPVGNLATVSCKRETSTRFGWK